jgi:hypothetical protein
MIRVIAAACGALLGLSERSVFFWSRNTPRLDWRIVALAAVITGGLAAAFGKRFWDTALGWWPLMGCLGVSAKDSMKSLGLTIIVEMKNDKA